LLGITESLKQKKEGGKAVPEIKPAPPKIPRREYVEDVEEIFEEEMKAPGKHLQQEAQPPASTKPAEIDPPAKEPQVSDTARTVGSDQEVRQTNIKAPVTGLTVPTEDHQITTKVQAESTDTTITLEDEEVKAPARIAGNTVGVQAKNVLSMSSSLELKQARRGGFVRMPIYKKNEETHRMEEIDIPDPKYYMPIGFDRAPGDGIMHYRYVVDRELEESCYIDESPFDKYDVKKG
jgi:hypothetical protein